MLNHILLIVIFYLIFNQMILALTSENDLIYKDKMKNAIFSILVGVFFSHF